MSQPSVPQEVKVKAAPRGNKRATVRYRCAPATVGKVFAANDQEFQRAWILDLSLTGLGMELSRPLEVGEHILIAIRSHDGTKVHELAARIMRCDAVPLGHWHIGCELIVPLTHDELDQLL